MGLGDLTRDGVLKAIAEFDRVGREAFLHRYGFGQSRSYFLHHEGRLYDSKAIAGAAHAYSIKGANPLRSFDFSGGFATVQAALNRLGFEVVSDAASASLKEWREAFEVGGLYTRDEVGDIVGYPENKRDGGHWTTGYVKHERTYLVFCNIGSAGRTGHDYPNRWDGHDLVWFGKSDTRLGQTQIEEMISGDFDVLIFWRAKDRAPFAFAGPAYALEVEDTSPVQVVWTFNSQTGPVTNDATEPGVPVFRRGPPPSAGERKAVFQDGPCSLYLMLLNGFDGHGGEPKKVYIKVGMSNAPTRRLREMNAGFPPRIAVDWSIKVTREHPDAESAFKAEGKVLEELRQRGFWIGGEFAAVPEAEFPAVLSLFELD